jgi:hypothetical protein
MALRAPFAFLLSICSTVSVLALAVPASGFDIATAGTEGLEAIVDSAGTVVATYQGTTGSYSNDLYLMLDGAGRPGDDGDTLNDRFLFNTHASPEGATVDLGNFAVGTRLPFRVHVNDTGHDFYTGEAGRNPDGHTHARVESSWQPGEALVSFEDLFGGGFEYNDLSFSFTHVRAGCVAGDTRLCLTDGRFAVSGEWQNQFDGSAGQLQAVPSSDLAGFFYFTDSANTELMVKILDFGSTIKLFYGQLTNLHFTLVVADTRTGEVKTYGNGPNDCGDLDDAAFPSLRGAGVGKRGRPGRPKVPSWAFSRVELGAGIAAGVDVEPSPDALAAMLHGPLRGATLHGATQASAGCVADAQTLCLLGGRFALRVSWRNQFSGASGQGHAQPFTSLAGSFSFDDPRNLELLVKVLDFGDRVLVLYGSLSNLEYTLAVTDTQSERTKTYVNPAGTYCGGLDNSF